MSTAPSLTSSASTSLDARALFATLAGLSGSLVAIGLARFAYTPLIPSLIQAHWFTSSQAVTLGAANFAGYLIGALIGRPLASALSNRTALRMLMAVVTAAFFACAYPLSISWFFVWRLLSGISGGAIMVLVATSILPHIPAPRRGFVSGMIFLGLGLGIAASGTLIPELLHFGLRTTWFGLGTVALVLTAVSWFGWPSTNPPAPVAAPTHHQAAQTATLGLRVLYAQYAANALGLVPAMILLVDYVARGLGRGAGIGANYWVLYGLAAIAGPVIAGNIADRIGYGKAYRVALLLQAAAVALLALSGNAWVLALSTVILGIFTPGVVPLALGRIHELVPHDHTEQRASWSRATTAFALFQALGGYGYSYLFSHSHNNYALIFACGAVALAGAFISDLIASRVTRADTPAV
ncbi:YbfB/YjiJ family MFS transporter [bacterium M00.F.Ca.ET.228.01.1.1]|uniref:YbfB/YjiJ family MFS transporter n=1 Tax=Paraburkholderia phenoliruptrix TaxID=252970 RepID=UPI001092AF48|nr:YbfB/YjiJ family MFS transporter [Paraburkholderia phenoliruptrix]TGP47419.1 YbfB/YjiJ family MFS transporter [bacterium M00.F.Ca.ET.228.01.1.1]TGS05211.1 YbfB/YjiJ family MFS transporter [bacterium M00.F.Ca.ET.191.01.1.1]TGU10147.1 YbfB/YjiJ family MFS transporter [bacterium M00.F.Ca.ET.155.01.1.1]MBW0449581.1 YbfB/YjiJ family MFS transporter [Paraburkholderia phenoliruptrix]MBW9101199.1 YbfB/YjiJ family MFS transporter [Paraburkholderia phenoliruptrix]